MPLRLVTPDGSSFRFQEYSLPDPGPNDLRIRVEFAAPKHGTEAHSLTGTAFDRKRWDPELRLFLPEETKQMSVTSERGIGNMVVGTVISAGSSVTRAAPGDSVFGYGQIQEEVQSPEAGWHPLGSLPPEEAVCVDPAHVAFVAVRDGNIRIGDDVAVFGLGAIGLLAARIARAGGARRVFVVDPMANRRECAARNGADAALDPAATDAGLEIKRATGGKGVDVAVETSGNGRALHEAIRCIRQCGTVVHVPWGPKDCSQLRLDEEFHLNRPQIIGSQAWSGWGNPDRSHPLWDHERAFQAAIDLFRERRISGEGIITPIVSFCDAAREFETLFLHPERAIKIGVNFS